MECKELIKELAQITKEGFEKIEGRLDELESKIDSTHINTEELKEYVYDIKDTIDNNEWGLKTVFEKLDKLK